VQTAELEDVAGAEETAEESDPFSATAEAARSEEAVTVVKAAPNRPASTVPPSLDDTGDWSAVDTAEATEVEQTAAEETEAAPQVEQVQAEFEFGGEPEETSALDTETPALTVPAPGEPEEFQFEDASPVRPAPTFPKAIPAEEPNAFSAPFEPGSIEPVVATRDPSDEKVHIVQSGETFWTIARHHYSAGRYFQALAEYNKPRIADARQLKPGMKVLVPSAETLEKQFSRQIGTAAPAAAAVKARAGLSYDAAGQALYRVGSKDTLSSIAQKHLGRSSRWTEIQQLNADTLKDPAALKPGMILKMPDDASQVREASSIPSDR
jgi:nucleoid-associated protein YgaU